MAMTSGWYGETNIYDRISAEIELVITKDICFFFLTVSTSTMANRNLMHLFGHTLFRILVSELNDCENIYDDSRLFRDYLKDSKFFLPLY